MQLQPGETFVIVRQLPDPNDGATYYVRAVIRDALTDATLETLNLTDQGSRRFSKAWSVYSKRSNGFYVAVTTTVYTDAGYTTKADNYAEEMQTYLVERRVQFGELLPAGPGISYEKIGSIVKRALAAAEKDPQEMPDVESIVAKAVDAAVAEVKDHVDAIEAKRKDVDLSQVLAQLGALSRAVAKVGAEVPASIKAELIDHVSGIRQTIDDVRSASDRNHADTRRQIGTDAAIRHQEVVHHVSKAKEASEAVLGANMGAVREGAIGKLRDRIADVLREAAEGPATKEGDEPVISPFDHIRELRNGS